jgi:hypothetical protein
MELMLLFIVIIIIVYVVFTVTRSIVPTMLLFATTTIFGAMVSTTATAIPHTAGGSASGIGRFQTLNDI